MDKQNQLHRAAGAILEPVEKESGRIVCEGYELKPAQCGVMVPAIRLRPAKGRLRPGEILTNRAIYCEDCYPTPKGRHPKPGLPKSMF